MSQSHLNVVISVLCSSASSSTLVLWCVQDIFSIFLQIQTSNDSNLRISFFRKVHVSLPCNHGISHSLTVICNPYGFHHDTFHIYSVASCLHRFPYQLSYIDAKEYWGQYMYTSFAYPSTNIFRHRELIFNTHQSCLLQIQTGNQPSLQSVPTLSRPSSWYSSLFYWRPFHKQLNTHKLYYNAVNFFLKELSSLLLRVLFPFLF